jgi:hypothetical protein
MAEVDLNKDVYTLLREKVSFHKEQAKLHARLASETQKTLSLLSAKTDFMDDNKSNQNEGDIVKMPPNMNFSVTIWKPKVEAVLQQADRPLRTSDIVEAIDIRYLEDEALKKQAIGAVSSCLFQLTGKKMVNSITGEGRGNLYTWVR